MYEAQERVDAFEFAEYTYVFEREREEDLRKKDKWEFYAASLQAEVRRSWVKDPQKVNDDTFARTFYFKGKDKEKPKELSSDSIANRVAKEKTAWAFVRAAGRLNAKAKGRLKKTPKRKK